MTGKGHVRKLVGGEESAGEKKLVYNARKVIDHQDSQKSSEKILQRPAEKHHRAAGMDRAAGNVSGVSGDGATRKNTAGTWKKISKVNLGGASGLGIFPQIRQRSRIPNSGCKKGRQPETVYQA